MPLNLHNSHFHLHLMYTLYLLNSFLLSDQCQAEDKQRGVCEPRDPVAAAVPEERHQKVSTGESD